MSIYLLTDSSAGFRLNEAARRGVGVVPLRVQFGEEPYQEDQEDPAGFYRKLAESKELPTTSQASPGDFLPYFERAKEGDDDLVCLTMASSLSGTYQSAMIAKEQCGYENIHLVDSTQTVLGLRLLVDLACLLRDQGMNASDIAAHLEQTKDRVRLLAVVDTLKYLHKGGRLSASVSIAGNLLKVKPILTLKNGELSMVGKGIGAKGSLTALVKQIGGEWNKDSRLPVYYGYTGDDTLCCSLMEVMEETFGAHRKEVCPVGAVIGTHVGPGAAVVVYLEQA